MTVRERVLSAKILLELQKNDTYAKSIGIQGNMKQIDANAERIIEARSKNGKNETRSVNS